MKIAITGATGFIGKILLKKQLSLNHEINILSRREVEEYKTESKITIFKGDLHSAEILEDFLKNVDILFNCASEINDESKMYRTNVEGTKNLIKAAKNRIKHWVQLSSVGVYGPIKSGIVYASQKCNPINTYEKTKLQSDKLVLEAANSSYFNSTIIRPSNVFGPTMKNNSLFALIEMIDRNRFFFIGQKGASANYIPAENVAHSLLLAATIKQNKKNEIYIVSDWVTLETFVQCIATELGKSFPKIRMPLFLVRGLVYTTSFIPNNPLTRSRIDALSNRVKYSNSKIEAELNYKPIITLEESLKKMVHKYNIQ